MIFLLFKFDNLGAHYRSHSTWDPRQRHLYEELRSRRGSNETVHTHRGNDTVFIFLSLQLFLALVLDLVENILKHGLFLIDLFEF